MLAKYSNLTTEVKAQVRGIRDDVEPWTHGHTHCVFPHADEAAAFPALMARGF